MPELTEQMYCHQQICIPPTFPYLLRQYAKAAIRSQPIDLLKWSTAYFRCLSLNIPPPVKPRLEYPIPKDYVGITPGWLKALNYQLQNNSTVPFKILWDRWIGSCLQHDTLIKILCLGGFTDPNAIPWCRFIGLCAGHLTENLTQTMILVCEILTEEPEGGSAMIPLETFLDIYKFLAAIDASKPQILLNLYFTDSLLNLYEKQRKKAARVASSEEMATIESSTPTAEEMAEEEEPEVYELGEGSIVSCPDIASDDALQEPELGVEREKSEETFTETKEDGEDEGEDDNADQYVDEPYQDDQQGDEEKTEIPQDDKRSGEYETQHEDGGEEEAEGERKHPDVGIEKDEEEEEDKDEEVKGGPPHGEEIDEEDRSAEPSEEKIVPHRSTEDELKQVERDIFEKGGIELDEDQVTDQRSGASEEEGESYDLVGLPESVSTTQRIEEMPGEGGFYRDVDEIEQHVKIKYQDAATDHEPEAIEEEEEAAEEVEVDAIPGIGAIVPLELVDAVERYLTKMASEDHGMTMPRHVRHYNCPPLEVFNQF